MVRAARCPRTRRYSIYKDFSVMVPSQAAGLGGVLTGGFSASTSALKAREVGAVSLLRQGRLSEALDVTFSGRRPVGDVSVAVELEGFVEVLCEPWIAAGAECRKRRDKLSCVVCRGVLMQPVTLVCGHTFCLNCIQRVKVCSLCGKDCSTKMMESLKVNILMSDLVEKWWPGEITAVNLRNIGNNMFAAGQHEAALEKYVEATKLAPGDFALLSNLSHLRMKMGDFKAALKDADAAINSCPSWPKARFRRSAALKGLGCCEEALLSLLYCVAYEGQLLPDISAEISKVLAKIISGMTRNVAAGGSTNASASTVPKYDSMNEDSNESVASTASSGGREAGVGDCSVVRICDREKLHKLADSMKQSLERLTKFEGVSVRSLVGIPVDASDLECSLCFRLLWQPVTTPCGHTFCRCCLDRCFDHNPSCPLCKCSLTEYQAARSQQVTEWLQEVLTMYLAAEYSERERIHEEELKEIGSLNKVPVFVCTVAYPTVPCPLHVFEPRYRLMLRRCMESGTRRFGMCAYADNDARFADMGTMLDIRNLEYFPDGRSVVDTVGTSRFRILRRGTRDGYNECAVEIVYDRPVDDDSRARVVQLHDTVRKEAEDWVAAAPVSLRARIMQQFGAIPPIESGWIAKQDGPAWLWWLIAILPLEPRSQLTMLSMTDLEKRLEASRRVLAHVRSRTT